MKAKAFEAARALAVERGLPNVTMPEIAKRTGIAPTSLYRRWGDVNSLLMDMAVERLNETFPLPDEGTLVADLTLWARRIAAGLNADTEVNFFRVLLATTAVSSKTRQLALAPRLEQLNAMLARARMRGEAAPEADGVIDHLIAPLYMRSVLGMPLDEQYADKLVRTLLKTMTA
ncbi:TetR/AcrR family transcriptional regulator [Pandoraea communis]|uniref:TetR/AcrR family transcriptional regulator n=1 Tax=Pandoraea communis TaxID=2508297 RepID=UPI001C2D9CD6|nr:TetR/AcrR family transcriptional regulator [Pandoraea communis]